MLLEAYYMFFCPFHGGVEKFFLKYACYFENVFSKGNLHEEDFSSGSWKYKLINFKTLSGDQQPDIFVSLQAYDFHHSNTIVKIINCKEKFWHMVCCILHLITLAVSVQLFIALDQLYEHYWLHYCF